MFPWIILQHTSNSCTRLYYTTSCPHCIITISSNHYYTQLTKPFLSFVTSSRYFSFRPKLSFFIWQCYSIPFPTFLHHICLLHFLPPYFTSAYRPLPHFLPPKLFHISPSTLPLILPLFTLINALASPPYSTHPLPDLDTQGHFYALKREYFQKTSFFFMLSPILMNCMYIYDLTWRSLQ